MRPLYERYPTSVAINGHDYPIETDFRPWIRFSDLLEEQEKSSTEKAIAILSYYKGETPPLEEGIIGALAFYAREDQETVRKRLFEDDSDHPAPKPEPPAFSFSFDAEVIAVGFWQAYRIDLEEIEYLHWHKFFNMLQYLPSDTEFQQRIHFRTYDLSGVTDAKERSRILKIQRKIAIPSAMPTAEDIGNIFW